MTWLRWQAAISVTHPARTISARDAIRLARVASKVTAMVRLRSGDNPLRRASLQNRSGIALMADHA
jgi:hypothetical protein